MHDINLSVKILLIEDNPGDARLIHELLKFAEEATFQLEFADDLCSGIKKLTGHEYDIVLLDLSLPDSHGLETFIKIHKHAQNIPVVVLTGFEDKKFALKTLQEGAQDYLLKSQINTSMLSRVIRYAIERFRWQARLKQETMRLQSSESRLQTIIHQNADGIIIVDEESNIQFLNPVAEALLGKQSDELTGTTFDFSTVSNQKNEIEITHRNKEKIFGEMRVAEIEWDEKPARLVSLRDITERKQAVNALKQSEFRFRQIIEKSNDAIIVISGDHFILANPKFEKMFGYSETEITGSKVNIIDFIAPESHKIIHDIHKKMSSGDILPDQFELKARSKDGKTHIAEVSISLFEWDQKTAILGILRDSTEKKMLEEQLIQSQKMEAIGALAAGISHDFNNILSVIKGYAQLALMQTQKDNPLYRILGEISEAGKRAANLVQQLLAFSRKQIIEPEILDVNKLISDLEKMLKRLIGEDINLKIYLTEQVGWIMADRTQLEQILINLVVNARDAIKNKEHISGIKSITIETERVYLNDKYISRHPDAKEGAHVCISINDSGIGMDEETINKIFEPFFTTKKHGEGTGLGLASVYGIVKQNNGSVIVQSEPGKGTTFKIYWPNSEYTGEVNVEDDEDSQIIGGTETILLVEDDEAVRNFGKEALISMGYTVTEAANGLEALDIVKSTKSAFDIVVSDMVMPRMGGKELAEVLAKIKPELKILFTSGYTDQNIDEGGVLKKGINFIHKPYSIPLLAKKIRFILDD